MRGFSLVEVMMAMVIASTGVLAITQGTITSLSNNTLARERIAGTNLALDVIESWQSSTSDSLPALQCTNGTVTLATVGNSTCQMISQEVKTKFTITVSTQVVQAPMQPATDGMPVNGDLYAGLRITSLLIDQTINPYTHIYAGTKNDGLFESTDSGSSWSKINTTGYLTINALAQQGTTIMAGTDDYTLANTSWGGTWQQLKGSGSNALPSNANVLSVTADSSTFYTGLDTYTKISDYGGVFKSSNTGSTWSGSLLGSVSNPYTVYSLTTSSDIYAGTDKGLYYSSDSGTSWVQEGSTTPAAIFALAHNGSKLYAGKGNGVFSTTDNGTTWSPDNANINNKKVTALSVVAGTDNITTGTEKNGVFSDLCGNNSNAHTTGLSTKPQLRIYSIAVPPVASPTVIYAGTDGGIFQMVVSSGAICGTWTRIDQGIGLTPKEKIVTVTWNHKGKTHSVVLTHITEKPY